MDLVSERHEGVEFVALPDGSLLVDGDADRPDVTTFASSLELDPPYRAQAVHRGGRTWAVGARSIESLELPGVSGDELEVVWDGGERSTRIDGVPTLGSIPELESHAASRYDTWVARAHHLRGGLWEVEVEPL